MIVFFRFFIITLSFSFYLVVFFVLVDECFFSTPILKRNKNLSIIFLFFLNDLLWSYLYLHIYYVTLRWIIVCSGSLSHFLFCQLVSKATIICIQSQILSKIAPPKWQKECKKKVHKCLLRIAKLVKDYSDLKKKNNKQTLTIEPMAHLVAPFPPFFVSNRRMILFYYIRTSVSPKIKNKLCSPSSYLYGNGFSCFWSPVQFQITPSFECWLTAYFLAIMRTHRENDSCRCYCICM